MFTKIASLQFKTLVWKSLIRKLAFFSLSLSKDNSLTRRKNMIDFYVKEKNLCFLKSNILHIDDTASFGSASSNFITKKKGEFLLKQIILSVLWMYHEKSLYCFNLVQWSSRFNSTPIVEKYERMAYWIKTVLVHNLTELRK